MKQLPLSRRLALCGSFISCLALAACAQAPSKTKAARLSSKSAAVTLSDTFKPSLAGDYPQITSEEMGRRFLKLVDGLKTVDALTPEYVAAETGLPLKYAPAGKVYSFTLHEPKSGWYYGLDYYQSPAAGWKTASVQFSNPTNPDADMAPVCGLDFDGYTAALKGMGFAMTPTYDMRGNVVEYRFYRGELDVSMGYREQARSTQVKQTHFCVESISVHGAK
ncbi:hypothetical protein [Lysobacter sp. Hz 25]|uniref:hypothetical protein n=1 Tax=Lysobacter sp. Hz 25 TaxID=3383698 RepID=UPI0038D3B01D